VETGALLTDYRASFLAFALFGVLHSVCAHEPFKDALARWTGEFFVVHYWRLVYCALSYLGLYYWIAVLHWGQNPDHNVWLIYYPDWLWQAITVLHLASIALIYVAFAQSDYLEFLGIRQATAGTVRLWRGQRQPAALSLFGTDRLDVRGVYGFVRHPMLSGGLLFLLTSGPSRNNLVFTAMYAIYMLIGGYYEERRMIRVFGDDYRRYRRRVGAYVPRLRGVRAD